MWELGPSAVHRVLEATGSWASAEFVAEVKLLADELD
jgi:hypothetical protein